MTCVAFIAISTFIAYRGITTSERVQVVLVSFQMLILLLFVVVAITRSLGGDDPLALPFSWTWFNPFTGLELSAFIAGVVGSIFAFWGWDVCLTVNEESEDSATTPGRAAIVTVLTILATYLLVAIAAMMYAGVGTEGLGLGNEETSDNVFGALAAPVLGSWPALLLFLAVLASSAARACRRPSCRRPARCWPWAATGPSRRGSPRCTRGSRSPATRPCLRDRHGGVLLDADSAVARACWRTRSSPSAS